MANRGERLFAFKHGDDRYSCELHDRRNGVEVKFFKNGAVLYSQRFDAEGRGAPTPWARAIQWANQTRRAIEQGPGDPR